MDQIIFFGETMISVFKTRVARSLAAAGVSTGILLGAAVPSKAAIDGMTWNWSNWWEANAYIEIYNHNICRQSVARLGDVWGIGSASYWYSHANKKGFNFTHEAYQRGC